MLDFTGVGFAGHCNEIGVFLPRDAMRKRGLNRKSYALYRMVTFTMTSTDINPVFKVTAYLKSNRKPYTVYRMVPLSVTLFDP